MLHKEIIEYYDSIDDLREAERMMVDETFVRSQSTYNSYVGGGQCLNTSGLAIVKDKDGITHTVSVDDDRIKSGELVGVAKGLIPVRDSNGNTFSVTKSDPRYISGEVVSLRTGKTVVKDRDGNTMMASVDDPRYISGELVSVAKGRVLVEASNGNTFFVTKSDPRYISGDFVRAKNKLKLKQITVRDKDNNVFNVSIDDTRYINGELIPATKGMKLFFDSEGNGQMLHPFDERIKKEHLIEVPNHDVMAVDEHGRIFKTNLRDKRFFSGEIKRAYPERIHTKETKEKISKAVSKAQSAEKNSQYGTMWIYNEELKQSKRISKKTRSLRGGKKAERSSFNRT